MSNPILNEKFIENERVLTGEPMTINGTIQITAFLGIILLAAAYYVWSRFTLGYTDQVHMLTYGGAIVGFILALIISFLRTKILIPVYAVCEGLALGGCSVMLESVYPGIVIQAITGTIATLFSMLILYRTGIIKVNDRLRQVIFTATLAIMIVYLINFIGSFWGHSVPGIMSSTPFGIGVSIVIILIAAFNLLLDFEFIERGAQNFLPKDYEWFGAFGLLVTLVWLYIEILRLLAKLQNRN